MSAKLRYSRTATIKLWQQHLGAQLPGTLPQPLNVRRHQEQCSRHKTIGTIPRYPRDPNFLVKFEKRRVKTLRQDALPERWRDWGVKRIPKLSDIYNPKWLKTFFQTQQRQLFDQAGGAPKVGEGFDYQLVMPSMRLYLLRVEVRLRGITALKAMSQVR